MTQGAFHPKYLPQTLPFYGEMGMKVVTSPLPDFHCYMGREQKIISHYTQNIDSIEKRIPRLDQKTFYLHGNISSSKCTNCRIQQRVDHISMYRDFWLHGKATICSCTGKKHTLRERKGYIVPDVVLYNAEKSQSELLCLKERISNDLAKKFDLVLVIGTSLADEVQDTRQLLLDLQCKGARVVYVNPIVPERKIQKYFDFYVVLTSEDTVTLLTTNAIMEPVTYHHSQQSMVPQTSRKTADKKKRSIQGSKKRKICDVEEDTVTEISDTESDISISSLT